MPPTSPSPGQLLGRYRILEQIGAVEWELFTAHDEKLDRYIALQVLPPDVLADEAARRRFRNEALTLSKLSHSNIATVHDLDSYEGIDFLTLEYVCGMPECHPSSRIFWCHYFVDEENVALQRGI